MVMFSACGDSSRGSAVGSTGGVGASAQEMEQEFRDLVRGTIEAAGTDPKSLRFGDYSDFSLEEFAVIDPAGYCGKVEGGDYEGQYRVSLESKRTDAHYSTEQYEAKVAAVWEYWEAQGMEPGYAPTGGKAKDIVAITPLGGKVSYMASLYGEVMFFESACSVKIKFGEEKRQSASPGTDSSSE